MQLRSRHGAATGNEVEGGSAAVPAP